jgi:hypothetical protein
MNVGLKYTSIAENKNGYFKKIAIGGAAGNRTLVQTYSP